MPIVITSPEKSKNDLYKLFLGGSIDNGSAINWQKEVCKYIFEDICVYNPRMTIWNPDASKEELRFQIAWELEAQEESDECLYYIAKNSISPITLLEIGLFHKKARVYCDLEYFRHINISATCGRYKIPLIVCTYDEVFGINIKISRYLYIFTRII